MSHWTSRDTKAFVHAISVDYIAQIETKLQADGITRRKFAKLLNVTPARVSQTLNDPSNFNLYTVVNYARVLGMKVAIVAYEDADPNNDKGPISADVFTNCWKQCGRPEDLAGFVSAYPSVQSFALTRIPQDAVKSDELSFTPIGIWFPLESKPLPYTNVQR